MDLTENNEILQCGRIVLSYEVTHVLKQCVALLLCHLIPCREEQKRRTRLDDAAFTHSGDERRDDR